MVTPKSRTTLVALMEAKKDSSNEPSPPSTPQLNAAAASFSLPDANPVQSGKKFDDLQKFYDELRTQFKSATGSLNELGERLEGRITLEARQASEVETLKKQMNDWKAKAKALQNVLEVKDAELSKFSGHADLDPDTFKGRPTARINFLEKRVSKIADKNADLSDEKKKLQEMVYERDDHIIELKKRVAKLDEQKAKVEGQAEALGMELKHTRNQLNKEQEKKTSAANLKIAQLRGVIAGNDREITYMRKCFEGADKDAKSAREECENIKKRVPLADETGVRILNQRDAAGREVLLVPFKFSLGSEEVGDRLEWARTNHQDLWDTVNGYFQKWRADADEEANGNVDAQEEEQEEEEDDDDDDDDDNTANFADQRAVEEYYAPPEEYLYSPSLGLAIGGTAGYQIRRVGMDCLNHTPSFGGTGTDNNGGHWSRRPMRNRSRIATTVDTRLQCS